jgi:PAS domain S-box-containing protein
MSILGHLNRFIYSLIEKLHPFNIKYFKVVSAIVILLLSGAVLFLGWRSSQKVREIVTDDFNQQQLVLARHAASQIQNSFTVLKRELLLLGLSPSIQYYESAWMDQRMKVAFLNIRDEGVIEIRFSEGKRHITHSISENQKRHIEQANPEDLKYLEWARNKENEGTMNVTPFTKKDDSQQIIMNMITPVWQTSTDESHPVALGNFSGVLVFAVDISKLIGNITDGIHSGKTGYAWVIDHEGTFLYHPDNSFVGANAFEARKEKQPSISFSRINTIQKEKMLEGEEGTSWYTSGWDRDSEGKAVKKLIAYTPIRLFENPSHHSWSVAVAAPIKEVEGIIHSIQTQHYLLQALIIVSLLFGGVFINFMILSWSNTLEQEVTKKTIELKISEQKYKSLVENAEDIIFTADYNGKLLSINKFGAYFFNRPEENIVGRDLMEIISWPSAEMLLLMIQKVFDTKESKQITHMVIVGDREYWLNTSLRRLWDEEGNIFAILGISRDITERKEMEEHSYYTEKLASMGTLAAGVAHEINNPLAIILGFADLLLEKFPPDSQEYNMLKTIERQSLNAKRVVENLLSFARHKEHKEENINLNENLSTVLSVMGNTLLLNKISVKENYQENFPLVKGDAGELQQVFFNVINNAIHVMKGGGLITITTRELDDEKIEIRITDTGTGIKKEYCKRIFDPLFTTKEVGKGTGLGLSVSYGIIKKHGGEITFETKTEEEDPEESGTTFVITLPTAK